MKSALTIDWAPIFDWEVIAVLAALSAALLALALLRRARGAWWRGLALTLLLLALANPILVKEQRDPLDDIALVVVDDSARAETDVASTCQSPPRHGRSRQSGDSRPQRKHQREHALDTRG